MSFFPDATLQPESNGLDTLATAIQQKVRYTAHIARPAHINSARCRNELNTRQSLCATFEDFVVHVRGCSRAGWKREILQRHFHSLLRIGRFAFAEFQDHSTSSVCTRCHTWSF